MTPEEKRARNREAARRYRERHPERAREANRRWAQKNPEKKQAANRKWAESNPEALKRLRKVWAAKRAKRRKVDPEYAMALKSYHDAWQQVNRARKRKGALPTWLAGSMPSVSGKARMHLAEAE